MPDNVTNLHLPPRISALGHQVVGEIALRLRVDSKVVMRAMMTVALHHQKELTEVVSSLSEVDLEW